MGRGDVGLRRFRTGVCGLVIGGIGGRNDMIMSEEIDFELEYKGGGYFREKGVPVGKSARVLHGLEILEAYEVLKKRVVELEVSVARLKDVRE